MGRSMGSMPPADIGRAGSSSEMPMGEPRNPFPKPLAGRVQDQLAEFADGAGRRAAMQPQPDYSDDTRISNEMDEITGNPLNNEIPESSPESHNIASTNLRGSPRQNKRGKMDSERVTPRMQGRAARSSSPFMGGQ